MEALGIEFFLSVLLLVKIGGICYITVVMGIFLIFFIKIFVKK